MSLGSSSKYFNNLLHALIERSISIKAIFAEPSESLEISSNLIFASLSLLFMALDNLTVIAYL